ncbi:MAG: M48 family metalloprotease [Gammaproteobacteria bacterium]
MRLLRFALPRECRIFSFGASALLSAIVACAGLTGAGLTSAGAANEPLRLPEMGDPASIVLSPTQEAVLGETLLTQIRGALRVSADPELNDYIKALGTRLAAAGLESGLDFKFLLVNDSTINAFAAPGGIVAINTGLLLTAHSESELAGVMAHEMAHVEQRHLARSYANAGTINLQTALAVLASILAGAYGGADVGQAALLSSMAAGAQAQLAFSRANEQEADRVGIRLLAAARFDPQGMPAFLQRLHQYSQLNAGPVPEYLSTHPVTLSRVSDTRSRAAQFSGPFSKDSARFHFAKARALALTSDPNSLISQYEETQRAGRANDTTDRYVYALALMRAGEPERGIETLRTIEETPDSSLPVDLALAQAYLSAGDPELALERLQRLNEIYPEQESIIYYLAQALTDAGRPRDALNHLEEVTRVEGHNPALDQLKAQAAAEADLPWISHESLADYYGAYGHFGAAVEQLELALNAKGIDPIARARIRSKRDRLTELQRENPPGEQLPSRGGSFAGEHAHH